MRPGTAGAAWRPAVLRVASIHPGPGMFVGVVRIELHLPAARSLKDKRQVIQSLKERIRHRVRAAVAEVDHQDLWQRAALGVAVVSGEAHQVDEMLQSVRELVHAAHGAELLDWQVDTR